MCPQIWLFFFFNYSLLCWSYCVRYCIYFDLLHRISILLSPYHLFLHRSPNVYIAGPEITNVFFFFFLPACLGHLIWHNLVHILERPIFWRDQSLDLTALGFIMLYLLLEPAHIEYVLYKKSSCELFILSDVRQKGLTVFSFFSQSFLNHLTYWAFSFPTVQTYCLDQEQLEWSWR